MRDRLILLGALLFMWLIGFILGWAVMSFILFDSNVANWEIGDRVAVAFLSLWPPVWTWVNHDK